MTAFHERPGGFLEMIQERDARWSTAEPTSTSTESRPVEDQRRCNPGVLVEVPGSGETTTSSILRRIQTDTAALAGVEFPSNSRSYPWVRRRKSWLTEGSVVEPEGYQHVASKIHVFLRDSAD